MIGNERELNNNWFSHIPANWVTIPMSIAFVPRNSKVSDKDFPPLSVTKNGIMPQIDGVAKTDNNDQRKLVMAGDYVINSRSDRKGSSGLSSMDGSVSLINIVFFPRDRFELNMEYYHFLFRSYYFCEEFYRNGTGIVDDLWSTNWERMKSIKIPIPPIKDQILISTFLKNNLAHLDALIEKKQMLIELLQEKRQAIIEEAVTKGLNPNVPMKDSGIEWLGNVPAHWRISKFKYISKLTSGGTPKRNNNVDYFENGDIDWVRTLDLTEDSVFDTSEKLTEEALMNSNCKMLPVNTLLIAMYGGGGTIGKSGILEIESTTNQAIASILPNDKYFYPRYLLRVLNFLRPHWMIYAEGARKDPNINLDVVANMPFPLPPINEQQKISLFLEKKLISLAKVELKIKKQIKQLQEYRQSLISEAVTGKIDIGE